MIPSNNFYEFVNRIYQQDLVTGYACGGPGEPCDAENRPYYRPGSNVTRQQMAKFIDNARHLPTIEIRASASTIPITVTSDAGFAIYAQSTNSNGVRGISTNSLGVYGRTIDGQAGVAGENVHGEWGVFGRSFTSGTGVHGESTSGTGVYGQSDTSIGVSGLSTSSNGVYGQSASGTGVYGISSSGWAGYFQGNIYVSGNCTGCSGPYQIDHPLDPANKYLYQSAVASSDMMNIYNGNVTLDSIGEATVQLPDWFGALNKDYRYQLTTIGGFAPVYIAEKVMGNRFKIAGGTPGMEVSWQVTGIRQDPYAEKHRIPVEEDKPPAEKGKYLHPDEWGQPESLGIDYDARERILQMPESTP